MEAQVPPAGLEEENARPLVVGFDLINSLFHQGAKLHFDLKFGGAVNGFFCFGGFAFRCFHVNRETDAAGTTPAGLIGPNFVTFAWQTSFANQSDPTGL
jgi:hypothetical protein